MSFIYFLFLNAASEIITVFLWIGVARGPRVPFPSKFSAHIVILCFEKRYPKQNSVIRLKSNILTPQIFGLATLLSLCM